jgi:small basic protein
MQELLNTLSKYPKFLIGVILGVFFNLAKPLVSMTKNPITAVALIGALVGGFLCTTFVLRGMLGLS